MNKNRKLIRRPSLGKFAELIDDEKLDEIQAYAERAMLEVPDEAWYDDNVDQIYRLFDWHETTEGYTLWSFINNLFTVAPLDRLAQIDAEIAALEAERRALEGK